MYCLEFATYSILKLNAGRDPSDSWDGFAVSPGLCIPPGV